MIPAGEAKNRLRRLLRERRRAIPAEQRNAQAARAAQRAAKLLRSIRARCVAVYLPYGSELDTAPLIARLRRRGCIVLVPRLDRADGRMHFARLRRGRHRDNRHGIAEPRGTRQVAARHIDAIIVPLLGVDARGTRLGAGGGYYDRWFARHAAGRRPLRIGYAFDEQFVHELPREPWDRLLHLAVSGRRLWRFRHQAAARQSRFPATIQRAKLRHPPG